MIAKNKPREERRDWGSMRPLRLDHSVRIFLGEGPVSNSLCQRKRVNCWGNKTVRERNEGSLQESGGLGSGNVSRDKMDGRRGASDMLKKKKGISANKGQDWVG